MTQPDPCGASCETAEDATAEARLQTVADIPRGWQVATCCGRSFRWKHGVFRCLFRRYREIP